MPEARSILVSGWRFIPHSYAVVNQFQCLEMLRRGLQLRLFFEDMPYFFPQWQAMSGLFDPASEEALRSIPPLPAGATPDAELRIAYPYDLLRPPRARRTFVFGTAEYVNVPPDYIAGHVPVAEAQRRHGFTIITPSNWSKNGFVRSGVASEHVAVIPHGFDPSIFTAPTTEQRLQIRQQIGLAPDEFVFLHAGAMTPNKGLRWLFPAFAQVLAHRPRARLVLKGMDALYPSQKLAQEQLGAVDPATEEAVISRLTYLGHPLTFADMAKLYAAADCYVSPYAAEGFNMPVLESAACGTPVICTAGGSTDDFVSHDFALRIKSELKPTPVSGQPDAVGLVPDVEHLTQLMLKIAEDDQFTRNARDAGPRYVAQRFTWKHVADRLLQLMLPD